MDLSKLSREKLLALLDAYARHTLATDGFWFMAVEDKFGHDAAMELDARVWEKLAEQECMRVTGALGLKERNVATVLQALEASPIALTLGPRTELVSESKGLIWFEDCRIQKTRIKMGLQDFICKPMGYIWFEGFARAVNPEIKVSCVFCHPEPHPPDQWCRWVLELAPKRKS